MCFVDNYDTRSLQTFLKMTKQKLRENLRLHAFASDLGKDEQIHLCLRHQIYSTVEGKVGFYISWVTCSVFSEKRSDFTSIVEVFSLEI